MMHNLLRTSAETTTSDQGAGERTDNHVDLGRVNVLVLSNATASAAENTKRGRFIEDQAELVFEAQFNLLSQQCSFFLVVGLTILGRSIMSP